MNAIAAQLRTAVYAAILALLLTPPSSMPAAAQADEGMTLIRDTEIENTIRAFAGPVFGVAGLNPNDMRIHLIANKRLNAFVTEGLNMFLHTGLLVRAEHPGQVIGVIAHETGHIARGHVARIKERLRSAHVPILLGLLAGIGLAVASQDPRAATAGTLLGRQVAERTLLKYTRSHEASADQMAVDFLDKAGISSRGMLEFLQILQGQEFLVVERQDPYVITHPVTSSRIEFVRQHIQKSPATDAELPPEFEEMHARMQAKLIAFLEHPRKTFQRYDRSDQSIAARYAYAIAHHRNAELDKAMDYVDGLIAERPNDPYFHELRGQILFESGHAREGVASLKKAVELLPEAPLIRTLLAQAELALNEPAMEEDALLQLEEAVRREKQYPLTWRLLGVVYGRQGDLGKASLALAEYSVLVRDLPLAQQQIARAEKHVEPGTPTWQRLQDLKRHVEELETERG